MSAEQGWIGEPQPPREFHRSRAAYELEKIAARESERLRDAEREARDRD